MRRSSGVTYLDQTALAGQLEQLRSGGGPRALIEPKDFDSKKFGILFRVAERLYPALWSDELQRGNAIEKMLHEAIKSLPDEKLPSTPDDSTVTWQEAALIMYDLMEFDKDVETEIGTAKFRYAGLGWHVSRKSGFYYERDTFKRYVNGPMREKLAAILLAAEVEGGMTNPQNSETPDVRAAVTESSPLRQTGEYALSIGIVNGPVFNGGNHEVKQTFNYGYRGRGDRWDES
ncbi:hypothetical protein [Nocardia bovistercoris]|uniref:Uncharacterized protein n=1 Tax=Nocardia bovistercoris TaxID=2785916 RepID=A0A931IEG6_9NOCA|nr:hypothetical protein [Nocardia bovistercoris]MBH0779939.1 hypothetical protein [Nocardia bovistercoris]